MFTGMIHMNFEGSAYLWEAESRKEWGVGF